MDGTEEQIFVVVWERFQQHSEIVATTFDANAAYDAIMEHNWAEGDRAPAGFHNHKLAPDREGRADFRLYTDGAETSYAVYVTRPYKGHGSEGLRL